MEQYNGGILLPVSFIGLSKECAMMGLPDCLEIWNAARWEGELAVCFDDPSSLRGDLPEELQSF